MDSSWRQRQWDAIDAMAGKLFREAEGLPGLELRSTEKAAQGIVAQIDGAVLKVTVENRWEMTVELSHATSALALTLMDAIKAYARLNGLLVCPACGHPQHAPTSCEELSFDGGICGCKVGVPEFDVIEGRMR